MGRLRDSACQMSAFSLNLSQLPVFDGEAAGVEVVGGGAQGDVDVSAVGVEPAV